MAAAKKPQLVQTSSRAASNLLKLFKTPSAASKVAGAHRNPSKVLRQQKRNDIASTTSLHCNDIGKTDCNSQDRNDLDDVLEPAWLTPVSNNKTSDLPKDKLRERKEKWVFKSSQVKRFDSVVKMCGETLGAANTIEAFFSMGRGTGKEYKALLESCIDDSRRTDDPEVKIRQYVKAYNIFRSMIERGFLVEEEIYGPFLKHLIDADMVQEFYFFSDMFIDENPASLPRLAYYEMLLCVRFNDKDKIQQLLDDYSLDDGEDKHLFQESYLLALCGSDCRRDLLMLLETFDVTKSSVERLSDIFKSLGRLSLEAFAKKFLLELKTSCAESATLTSYIYDYSISIPNLVVEDSVPKFKQFHSEMEIKPTFTHYEKLIRHHCKLRKVDEAINLADEMFNLGATSSLETIHAMLDACLASYEFSMVHRIYSLINRQGLKPNDVTYNSLITLFVRMKDYRRTYDIIRDMAVFGLEPTSNIFNTILAGYVREKNKLGVKTVLKQMEQENVKPNSRTYSYLISHCESEKEIIKNFEKMKVSEVQVSKHVYMALIKAYAACGEFEKAKQVILDDKIPAKNLKYFNELRSVTAAALASHGQLSDALTIYEKIKQDDCSLEPTAAISLIDNLESKGELDVLLKLLEELKDTDYWIDGCYRAHRYCVRHNHISCAIDLLKNIRDHCADDEVATETIFDEVFFDFMDQEPKDMKFGLELLRALKEDMGIRPSRKILDFLLDACVCANDLKTAYFIWKEYQTVGLTYNVLSFLRMYRTLLALGDLKYAKEIVKNIPQDDHHISYVIEGFEVTYLDAALPKMIKKKEKPNKKSKKKRKAAKT